MDIFSLGSLATTSLTYRSQEQHSSNKSAENLNDTFIQWFNPSSVYDDAWYMKTLGVTLVVVYVFYNLAFVVLVYMSITAAKRLYDAMFARLLKAPTHFFERNPVGR